MRVTLGVLARRINRKLRRDDQMLKKARSGSRMELGDFYILNLNRNVVVAQHVDPVALGRQLGVLDPDEVVSE